MEDTQVLATPVTPSWFVAALAAEPTRARLSVGDVEVAYREWRATSRDEDRAPLVLLHGVAAHSGWWDHVGPQLAERRRVVAVDLAGHGDSDRRADYTIDTWAHDVLSLLDALQLSRAHLVGHSLGGIVAMRAAQLAGERLAGIVVLESVIEDPHVRVEGDPRLSRSATTRVHPDRESALQRWRPLPAGAVVPDFTARHVAEGSVREVEGGWSWKFDPRVFLTDSMHHDQVEPVRCRVALFRGEIGSVGMEAQARVAAALGDRTIALTVPGAGHNLTLETPRAVTLALTTLLAAWDQEA